MARVFSATVIRAILLQKKEGLTKGTSRCPMVLLQSCASYGHFILIVIDS